MIVLAARKMETLFHAELKYTSKGMFTTFNLHIYNHKLVLY